MVARSMPSDSWSGNTCRKRHNNEKAHRPVCLFIYKGGHFRIFGLLKTVRYAILDIETTGGNANTDRITEIAIYLHDGERVVDEFVSLINPERRIPPFISRLTGIDDSMVAEAPRFFEVAKDIVKMTEGAVVVAHNAQFDYSFIREEYRSLGFTFSRDYLCTVRLSRKLLPGHRSYSLGNLCERLGITIENRHRAAGDALATVRLFEMLIANDRNGDILKSVKNDYLHLRFPPNIDRSLLDKLPESPGVYYLHNEDGSILYVGKSNNIRKRVLSHFVNKQNRKALELRNAIHDVTFTETGNELIALLLESDEIKKLQPRFNRAQRRTFFRFGIISETTEAGYFRLKPARVNAKDEPLVVCGSAEEARTMLERLCRKFQLCQKLCGLYDIQHACFQHSIGQCNGACVGKESAEAYNERVESAIASLRLQHPNFFLFGRGRTTDERSVVHVENGRYRGFGYADEGTGQQLDDLRSVITLRDDNRDIQRILRQQLMNTLPRNLLIYQDELRYE